MHAVDKSLCRGIMRYLLVSVILICWIVIYLADSNIHCLKNWSQMKSLLTCYIRHVQRTLETTWNYTVTWLNRPWCCVVVFFTGVCSYYFALSPRSEHLEWSTWALPSSGTQPCINNALHFWLDSTLVEGKPTLRQFCQENKIGDSLLAGASAGRKNLRLLTTKIPRGTPESSWWWRGGGEQPVLQILTLLQTKTCNFPHPFSDQTSKIHTRFQIWPLARNYVIIT